jgi:hypothetical protein
MTPLNAESGTLDTPPARAPHGDRHGGPGGTHWFKFSVWTVLLGIAVLAGCVNRDRIYANPPQELIDYVDAILPKAEAFVLKNEREALENGVALDSEELAVANRLGLDYPEKVRVYYVDQLPQPSDPQLATLAEQYGYSSPKMDAYTFGYGVFVRESQRGNQELLAHELIHIRQAEQMGRREQIRQYLFQLFIYGYDRAPLELEAYRESETQRDLW